MTGPNLPAADRNPDQVVAEIERLALQLRRSMSPDRRIVESAHRDLAEMALALAHQAKERLAEQNRRIAHLEHLVITDELTGVLNRRGFQMRLTQAIADARRRDEPGLLIFIDLDGFKKINDSLGHNAGDEVLRRVSAILGAQTRETDAVGRLGGDEFVVLFPNTRWHNGWKRARELEHAVNSASAAWQDRIVLIKASFGIEPFCGEDEVEGLLGRADEKMYQRKHRRQLSAAG